MTIDTSADDFGMIHILTDAEGHRRMATLAIFARVYVTCRLVGRPDIVAREVARSAVTRYNRVIQVNFRKILLEKRRMAVAARLGSRNVINWFADNDFVVVAGRAGLLDLKVIENRVREGEGGMARAAIIIRHWNMFGRLSWCNRAVVARSAIAHDG